MTWWQILLVIIGFVICWFAGSAAGYDAGWKAHERATSGERDAR